MVRYAMAITVLQCSHSGTVCPNAHVEITIYMSDVKRMDRLMKLEHHMVPSKYQF